MYCSNFLIRMRLGNGKIGKASHHHNKLGTLNVQANFKLKYWKEVIDFKYLKSKKAYRIEKCSS